LKANHPVALFSREHALDARALKHGECVVQESVAARVTSTVYNAHTKIWEEKDATRRRAAPPRVNLKREWVDAAVRVGDTAEEGEGQGRGGDIAGETRTGRVMLKAKGEEG
jgi:hypothetical protein